MPRYAETIDDCECFDLVIWKGTLYGVLYSDREFAGLIPIDKLRTHQGDDQKLYGFAVRAPIREIQLPDPVKATPESVRSFFRLEAMPWDLIEKEQFPFDSSIRPLMLTEEDLLCLFDHIALFQNEFIRWHWGETFLDSDENARSMCIRLPVNDEPGFTFRFLANQFFEMIDYYDPEEDDIDSFSELRDCYLRSKGKPLTEMVLPDSCKANMAKSLLRYAKNHPVTDELRETYVRILDELVIRIPPRSM